MNLRWSFALCLVMLSGSSSWGAITNFAVGNSLTWDLLLAGGFDLTTRDQPQVSVTPWHIRCGSSLTATLNDPNTVCVAPVPGFGLFDQGLRNPIDNLILQPFQGANISLRDEVESVKRFIDLARENPANDQLQTYIYATWPTDIAYPGPSAFGFLNTWNNHIAQLEAPYTSSRSTFQLMTDTLAAEGYCVQLIPAGHAFAAVVEAMLSGTKIDGINQPSDLFRDGIHASNAGRYIAAISAFAAIYDIDPTGKTIDASAFYLNGYGPTISPAGANGVQQIVWDTYLSINAVPEPRTCVVAMVASVGCVLHRRRATKRRAAESYPQAFDALRA